MLAHVIQVQMSYLVAEVLPDHPRPIIVTRAHTRPIDQSASATYPSINGLSAKMSLTLWWTSFVFGFRRPTVRPTLRPTTSAATSTAAMLPRTTPCFRVTGIVVHLLSRRAANTALRSRKVADARVFEQGNRVTRVSASLEIFCQYASRADYLHRCRAASALHKW